MNTINNENKFLFSCSFDLFDFVCYALPASLSVCHKKPNANTLKISGINKYRQRSLETQKQYTDSRIALDESFIDQIKCIILIPEMYSYLYLTMPFWIWHRGDTVFVRKSQYHVLNIYTMVMLCYCLKCLGVPDERGKYPVPWNHHSMFCKVHCTGKTCFSLSAT